MITVKAYLYPNTVEVEIWDPTITTTRNRVVYSRPITIYKGIDNPLQLIIRNQDQKAVDVGDADVFVEIQNPDAKTTVASFLATPNTDKTGVFNVTIDRDSIDNLTKRFYKLTIKTRNTLSSVETPVYINDNYITTLQTDQDLQLKANGSGKIYVFGWDWFGAVPLGGQDGGWLHLLHSVLES